MSEQSKELMVQLFRQLKATVAARAQGVQPGDEVSKAPVVDMGPVMDQKIGQAMNELVQRYVELERERLGGGDAEVLVDDAFLKRWGPHILAELFSVFVAHAPGMNTMLKPGTKSDEQGEGDEVSR